MSATETSTDLARRLASHPRFAWIEGMVDTDLDHVIAGADDGVMALCGSALPDEDGGAPPCRWVPVRVAGLPNLSNPAMAGVLLGMLDAAQPIGVLSLSREMYDDEMNRADTWVVSVMVGGETRIRQLFSSMVKGEAIARALLAVWGPTT